MEVLLQKQLRERSKTKEHKQCSRCGSDKTHIYKQTGFHQWRYTEAGHLICHKCYCKTDPRHINHRKVWNLEHREEQLYCMKVWKLEHREHHLNYMKVWHLDHPDYNKVLKLERLAYHGTDLARSPELERLATRNRR